MARALLREGCLKLKVFERRFQFEAFGTTVLKQKKVPISSDKPYFVKPISSNGNIIWPSPAYEYLDTNVPKM